MAQSSQTAALNRMHVAVKELSGQLDAVGQLPHESVADLKSAVDDVRLRAYGSNSGHHCSVGGNRVRPGLPPAASESCGHFGQSRS